VVNKERYHSDPEYRERKLAEHRDWQRRNIERVREHNRRYRERHREEIKARRKAKYASDPELRRRVRERARKWALENPERYRENMRIGSRAYYLRNRDLVVSRLAIKRAREQVIDRLGARCECCGETIREFLTIDHRNRDGGEHRRKFHNKPYQIYMSILREGCPTDKYQVLCMNCNFATRYGEPCPHAKHELERLALMVKT